MLKHESRGDRKDGAPGQAAQAFSVLRALVNYAMDSAALRRQLDELKNPPKKGLEMLSGAEWEAYAIPAHPRLMEDARDESVLNSLA
jgi:hypothetical protein